MMEEPKTNDNDLADTEQSQDVEPVVDVVESVPLESSDGADSSAVVMDENADLESDLFEAPSDDGEFASAEEFEGVIGTLQQEIANLRQQLDAQTQVADNMKGQYMRIAADFENFRKRTGKEKEELELRIKCSTVTELLGAIDNFERARVQIKPANDGELNIHKSYQGVYKQIVDALKRIGVSAMRPEGHEFDPTLHEAVFQEPTAEYAEGTVIEQVVRGYMLGDKVLRHAMVKVAAAPIASDEVVEASEMSSDEGS